MSERKIGEGDVAITIQGKEFKLRPSNEAIQELSRFAGGMGIRGILESLLRNDIMTVNKVVELGLGKEQLKQVGGLPKLPGLLFAEGYTDDTGGLLAKCLEYAQVLLRGGRAAPLPDEEEPDQEKKET